MADVSKLESESSSSAIQDETSSNERPTADWSNYVHNYPPDRPTNYPSQTSEQMAERSRQQQTSLEIPPLLPLLKAPRYERFARTTKIPHWSQLENKTPLWPCDQAPAELYEFRTGNGSRVNLVVCDLKSGAWQLRPAINDQLHPTSEKAEKDKVTAAINGGYFAPKGESVSYVIIDGQVVADPSKYTGFQKEYRAQILNRSELRVLVNQEGKTEVDIAPHDAPVPEGSKIFHSLQAGPNLLKDGQFDETALRTEAFIRKGKDNKDIDVIRSSSLAARTAVGITKDGFALMASVADKSHDPASPGVSIKQLALLMSALGCTKAINLDGGASTTMFARTSKEGVCEVIMKPGKDVNTKKPQTWVKSILELRHIDKH